MGNRAVITTRENFDNNGVGVYLHWNGSSKDTEHRIRTATDGQDCVKS